MGRPSSVKPAPQGTSRRDFFKRSSSAAVAIAALPALSLDAQAGSYKGAFQHGVASGDPLSDRVILWTRVTPTQPKDKVYASYVVARDPALSDVVTTGQVTTTPGRDFTVKVDVSGLQPGTTYYYQFSHLDKLSPVGRTRTLPAGSVDQLRLAVVSCSNYAYGYFNAYGRIAERADLDAVLHLGDYLYEYADGQYGSLRKLQPSTEILSLADYRMRHAQYKTDPDAQAMHRQHPMIAIWDDHETANNAWKDGAENQNPGEGNWPDRVAAALQAYYEWMPVRMVDKDNPRRNNRNVRFGNLVDLYMLEERVNARSEQLPATVPTPLGLGFTQTGDFLDPSRTLLGDTEEQWLTKGLRKSTTSWRLLGQGVMFAQLKAQGAANAAGGGAFLNPDQWDGYQPQRDRIYKVLKGTTQHAAVGNVVVLTGDIHSAWAADLSQDPNNSDLASGGYNASTGAGSAAVEFVGTSVTSPGIDDPTNQIAGYLKSQNPHFKHIDLNRRGYMLLDIDASRIVCEFWNVDTITAPSTVESLSTTWQVTSGSQRLSAGTPTLSRSGAPVLAP
ncbi:MAG TPA: alkaline phosphatase D family protein [Ideonella sp.]|uniref:alkaline phosphatase D family protein n=1 Tax=Ideonella sp. TaxID=1929293 RepID=UPI002C2D530F|nr:alkaline phosphatase D family protein [Ideonella sp.]HSI52094.1 alkaline phosphatase D family protein [Ideonella sp.]